MSAERLRPSTSVRTRLLLLAGVPFVVSLVLLGLFSWASYASTAAFSEALLRHRHARAMNELDWNVSTYVEDIGDRFERDPPAITNLSDIDAVRHALARSRDEASALAQHFSRQERDDQASLSTAIDELLARSEQVGVVHSRYEELRAFYAHSVLPRIRRRLDEEEIGSSQAIAGAERLSRIVQGAGLAIAAVVLLALLAVSLSVARKFSRSVTYLQQRAQRVAAGDLDVVVALDAHDELGELAASLNSMVTSLYSKRQQQLGFLAGVAHDLRNPLAALRTATEGLVTLQVLPPAPAIRRTLELINRQVDRLSRMADDLLDAARTESGELDVHVERCDLRDLAHEAGELYAQASPQHAIRVAVPDEAVCVDCDPARIVQILNNLVSNAIKYSPAGGVVDVSVVRELDEAVLSVTDRGVGIEPAARAAIFEPFRRVSPTKDVLPGIGLGLAICRRIAAAHGGTIEVHSVPGQGSTFRVKLPVARPHASGEQRP